MAQVRHLTNAPVKEALLDFQFAGNILDIERLRTLAATYTAKGWVSYELRQFEATVAHEAGESQAMHVSESSWVFEGLGVTSPDRLHVVQFRGDRVTVSEVGSYTTWEDLLNRASTSFNEFVNAAGEVALTRIGVRYINRIRPNANFTRFEEVLERPPVELPGLAGARITNFLRRHVVEGLAGGFTGNLTIGTAVAEAGEDARNLPAFLVDVDVYKACAMDPVFDAVAEELEIARRIKNTMFFGSLKDEAVESYE